MDYIFLANGTKVPKACVDALDEFDKVWPGASFPKARAAIVNMVLFTYAKIDNTKESGVDVSADNGYILRKRKDGLLVLQMYSASADAFPPIDNSPTALTFANLESAMDTYEMGQDDEYWSEYGLTLRLKE